MSGDQSTGERTSSDLFARAVARVRARVFDTIDVLERFDALVSQSQERASSYEVAQLSSYLCAPPTVPGQHMRLISMLTVHEDHARALEVLREWTAPREDRELVLFRALAIAHMTREDVRPELASARDWRQAA